MAQPPSLPCLLSSPSDIVRRPQDTDSSGESHTSCWDFCSGSCRAKRASDLFAKQAANIHVGAEALLKMLSHYTGVPEQVQIVKAIEHEGDEITHGRSE